MGIITSLSYVMSNRSYSPTMSCFSLCCHYLEELCASFKSHVGQMFYFLPFVVYWNEHFSCNWSPCLNVRVASCTLNIGVVFIRMSKFCLSLTGLLVKHIIPLKQYKVNHAKEGKKREKSPLIYVDQSPIYVHDKKWGVFYFRGFPFLQIVCASKMTGDSYSSGNKIDNSKFGADPGLPTEEVSSKVGTAVDAVKVSSPAYRCKKCRRVVAVQDNVVDHVPGEGETSFQWHKRRSGNPFNKCDEMECSSIFVEPLRWMTAGTTHWPLPFISSRYLEVEAYS